jgi:hypothetical protein
MRKIYLLFFLMLYSFFSMFAATGWYQDYVIINKNNTGEQSYWIGDNPGFGTQLDGHNLGTVSSLVIERADMKYWSDSQDRDGGSFFYMIKSADGSETVLGPTEVVWVQQYLLGNDYRGLVTNINANLLATLSPATTYQLHIYAKSWGSNQGDSWLSNNGDNYVATFTTSAIMVTGATGIADGTGYDNVRIAFNAINANTNQSGRNIEVKIGASVTETTSATLQARNWSSLVLYPTKSDVTIDADMGLPVVSLNGAKNVTIDGRVNRSGSTPSLLIRNNSKFGGAVALSFLQSAQDNIVQYTQFQGRLDDNSRGVVFFGSAYVGTGNSNNIVQYNEISGIDEDNRPRRAIASNGTPGRDNKNNQIIHNKIFNFIGKDASSIAILLIGGSQDFTISNNHIYETVDGIEPQGGYTYWGIRTTSSASESHLIENNYIGGSAPFAAGTWRMSNASAPYSFTAIYASGTTTKPTIVRNNVMRNFHLTLGASTSNHDTWDGIFVNAGNVDVLNNTIGAETGTGSIYVKSFGGTTIATSHGILNNSTGIVNIKNNKIGSFTIEGTEDFSHSFEGVYLRAQAGTTYITDNLLGSLTTPNSIHVNGNAANSLQKQDVYGIYSASQNTTYVLRNTLANITNAYTGSITTARTRGIRVMAGSNYVENNTVFNVQSHCSQNLTISSGAAVIGIEAASNTAETVQHVIGNTIYNISNLHPTGTPTAVGVYFWGPTNVIKNRIEKNFIHSMSLATTDANALMVGIVLHRGNNLVANNIVSLGSNVNRGYRLYGVWDDSGSNNNNDILFNTVSIVGNVTTGSTSISTALWNQNNTSVRNYQNNILANLRTVSGSGNTNFYVVRLGGVSNLTIDYNNYYSIDNGLGRIGTSPIRPNLSSLRAATGQDANSIVLNPDFQNETNTFTQPNDFLTSPAVTLRGTYLAAVATDFDGLARLSIPKMGAFENNNYVWVGSTSTDFNTASNWEAGVVPPNGADIIFAVNPVRSCLLDQNRTIRNLNNAQGTHHFVLNGRQLTLTGNLNLTNGAKVNATESGSVLNLSGTQAQVLPIGAMVDNTIAGLTVNNEFGLSLTQSLTISQNLYLQNGDVAINNTTLTLNGSLTQDTGSLLGGATSSLIFGGNGASTNLPAVLLQNLTVNRVAGITMTGNVTVGNSLTLTAGTLVVAGNTLQLSGNTLSRTSGSMDASAAESSVVFANSTGVILPANTFSSDIQNLTLSTSAGVTASSNLAVLSSLNLLAANPSAIKGLLDMGSYVLEMKNAALTTGTGDVTGRIVRNGIVPETTYTFGHANTTIRFYNAEVESMPSQVKFISTIGQTHLSKNNTIERHYQIVRTGGTSPTRFTLQLHYLESELNGLDESNLVFWDHHIPYNGTSPHEHGKTELNTGENWISLSGHGIQYLVQNEYAGEIAYVDDATTPQNQTKIWQISEKESISDYVWLGAISTSWDLVGNWSGSKIPTSTSDIIIPANTPYLATVPANETREVKSVTIEQGGTMIAAANSVLDVYGALEINNGTASWENNGEFVPATGTVVFKNANAAIAGTTNFNNLTIPADQKLIMMNNSVVRIANTFDKQGVLDAYYDGPTTVEYNGGNQTIALTENNEYYNLIISGTGTKTMPGTALSILGNLSVTEETSATAQQQLTIDGNVFVDADASFGTGNFNHIVKGNITVDGAFTANATTSVTLSGSASQSISGESTLTFANLIVSNASNVQLFTDAVVNEELSLVSGNLNVDSQMLRLNGTINKTGGFVGVTEESSLYFGGTSALSLPANVFSATPTIHSLTVNRTGGVSMSNQDLTIANTLNLTAGSFTVGANTLQMNGSELTRGTGSIVASNALSNVVFGNLDALLLPSASFSGNVTNLSLVGTGGVTSAGDITITNNLHLQANNPSATKGLLDMKDGASNKTLTMGSSATTTGIGDVTGIIKRTSFVANIPYTFGSAYTTVTFDEGGTYPTEMNVKVEIGTAPAWKPEAILRVYDFIRTGGNAANATISTRYLESELNGNDEQALVQWTFGSNGQLPEGAYEWGKSISNTTDNWVSISNVSISQFPVAFGNLQNTLGSPNSPINEWIGVVSSDWSNPANWSNGIPEVPSDVIVPDASTVSFSPTLANSVEIHTITIQPGAVLNGGTSTFVLNGGNGAWINQGGTFNAGTSTVVFDNPAATIDGVTNFYNIQVPSGAALTVLPSAEVGFLGQVSNQGSWTNNGTLVILSDDSREGQFKNDGSVVNNGELIFRKAMKPSHSWVFIGFPFEVTANRIRLAGTSTQATWGDMPYNASDVKNFYAQWYDAQQRDAQGTAVMQGSSHWKNFGVKTFVKNKGYIIAVASDITLDFVAPTGETSVFATTGSVGVNKYTTNATSLTHHSWNLLGQPFLSSFEMLHATQAHAPYYYYNGATYVAIMSGDEYQLRPFGAYFVQAHGAPASMAYANDGRRLRNVSVSGFEQISLLLKDNAVSHFEDLTRIRLQQGRISGFELGFDAIKMPSENKQAPQIATVSTQIQYAVNALPTNTSLVDLVVTTGKAGSYTISLENIDDAPSYSSIILVVGTKEYDLLEGSYTFSTSKAQTMNWKVKLVQGVVTQTAQTADNRIDVTTVNNLVYINGLESEATVSVYTVSGKLVQTISHVQNNQALTINNTGISVLTITTSTQQAQAKVLVE